jgi:hypothetical protein
VSVSHAKRPPPSIPDQGDALDRFKTTINLTEFATSEDYLLDHCASSRNSAVMRHPGGDKIIITPCRPKRALRLRDQEPRLHGLRVPGDRCPRRGPVPERIGAHRSGARTDPRRDRG